MIKIVKEIDWRALIPPAFHYFSIYMKAFIDSSESTPNVFLDFVVSLSCPGIVKLKKDLTRMDVRVIAK